MIKRMCEEMLTLKMASFDFAVASMIFLPVAGPRNNHVSYAHHVQQSREIAGPSSLWHLTDSGVVDQNAGVAMFPADGIGDLCDGIGLGHVETIIVNSRN